LALIGALQLTACGGGSQAARQSPEAVHQAWVDTLRTNDRQAAQALVTPELARMRFADWAVNEVPYAIRNQSDGVRQLGPLQGVTTQPLTDVGKGKLGISIWRFARWPLCWQTELTLTAAGWRVVRWGTTNECPAR
jgi:hypothetical protein